MGLKQLDLRQLEQELKVGRAEAELIILSSKPSHRSFRRRPRDEEEQGILDRIAVEKWKAAEEAGKIRYSSKTEWYYEY